MIEGNLKFEKNNTPHFRIPGILKYNQSTHSERKIDIEVTDELKGLEIPKKMLKVYHAEIEKVYEKNSKKMDPEKEIEGAYFFLCLNSNIIEISSSFPSYFASLRIAYVADNDRIIFLDRDIQLNPEEKKIIVEQLTKVVSPKIFMKKKKEVVDLSYIGAQLIKEGFKEKDINFLLELILKLELPKEAKVLFVGSGFTPLQFLMASKGNEVDVMDVNPKVQSKIEKLAKKLNIELNVFKDDDSDFSKADLKSDQYDYISLISILDLMPFKQEEVFKKILNITKHQGKVAIGHYDIGIATRHIERFREETKNNGCGINNLGIRVGDTEELIDSTLLEVLKRDIDKLQKENHPLDILGIFTLFASLKK